MAQIPSSVDIFSRNMTREDEDCGLGWGQVGGLAAGPAGRCIFCSTLDLGQITDPLSFILSTARRKTPLSGRSSEN